MVSVLRSVIHGCQVGAEGHVGKVDVISVGDQDVVLVAMDGRVSRRVDDRFAGFRFVWAGHNGFIEFPASLRLPIPPREIRINFRPMVRAMD